jgi:hypothetical protein
VKSIILGKGFNADGSDNWKVDTVLTFSYSFLGLSLPFLASFVPLPPVVLMIPIFYDRLIDNLSTNQAPPANEGTIWTGKLLMNHHPATSIAIHIKLQEIVCNVLGDRRGTYPYQQEISISSFGCIWF